MKQELELLYEKQKKNSRLSKTDGKKFIDISTKMLNEDNELIYEYLFKIGPEYGMESFMRHLKSLKKDEKDRKIQRFLEQPEFKKNNSNTALKRGLILSREIFNQDLGIEQSLKVLGQTCKVAIKSSKSGVNSQIINYTYQDFVIAVNPKFYNIEMSKYIFIEEYLVYIDEIFRNTVFPKLDLKMEIDSKYQLEILKWFKSFKTRFNLNAKEMENINSYIESWPEDLKKILFEDNDMVAVYGKDIEPKESDKPKEEIDIVKEIFQDKDIFNQMIDSIKEMEKGFLIKDKELEKVTANLSFYRTEYEKIKLENNKLQNQLDNLIKTNKIEIEKKEELSIENNKLKEMIKELKEKEEKYQQQVEDVFANSEIMKKSTVDGFKKTLGSNLRIYYKEFEDIKDEKVDELSLIHI